MPSIEPKRLALAPLIEAGFDLIPLRGKSKEPLHKNWTVRRYEAAKVAARCESSGQNVGVRLRADQLVIDVDPRNGGEMGFRRLCRDLGLDQYAWPHVETGSGGSHYYMSKPAGIAVVNSVKRYPGVEFKSLGRQVVAPGSIHPDTGKAYEHDFTSPGFANAPDAPEALLRLITRPEREAAPGGGEHSAEEVGEMLERLDPTDFRDHDAWLRLMMACHHASGGEARDEFVSWSVRDPQYESHDEQIGRRWDSLHADSGSRVTHKTLYKFLIDAGHADAIPRAAAEDDFADEEQGDDSSKARHAGGLTYFAVSDVRAEPIEWLWPQRFAVGKLSGIAGHPDEGKSQITCFMASAVSRGGEWPDGGRATKGKVVFLSAEDDAGDTIRPRLEAAGASIEDCFVVEALVRNQGGKRMFNLADDLERLTKIVKNEPNVKLLVIDPISAYLGGRDKADSYRNAEVRALLAPLADWAARHRIAVVFVTHFNKSGNGRALGRVTDSIAFTALARAVWLAVPEPADEVMGATGRRLLVRGKLNIAEDPGGLAYKIEGVTLPSGITAPRVVWDGRTDVTADEALAPQRKPTAALDAAETFLFDMLTEGPAEQPKIKERAEGEGHSWASVRRAKKNLGVVSKQIGKNLWTWTLPEETASEH